MKDATWLHCLKSDVLGLTQSLINHYKNTRASIRSSGVYDMPFGASKFAVGLPLYVLQHYKIPLLLTRLALPALQFVICRGGQARNVQAKDAMEPSS